MSPTSPLTPADQLAAVLSRDAAAPLVTHYDDATGERIELSGTTLANWVAKSANLLQDEFDIGPGGTVAVVLPVHWQTAVVLLGIWSCGAAVLDAAAEDDGRLADVVLALAAQERLPAVEQAAPHAELLGLSLHPMGGGMAGYTGPARDFAVEVRTAGDRFTLRGRRDPGATGLLAGRMEMSLGDLTEAAGEMAARLGIVAGDRILVDAGTAAEAGPVAWLLAPLAAGASLVLCRHPDAERLPARAETERVTATLGCHVPGIRELGRG